MLKKMTYRKPIFRKINCILFLALTTFISLGIANSHAESYEDDYRQDHRDFKAMKRESRQALRKLYKGEIEFSRVWENDMFPISDTETVLPHNSQPVISGFEEYILTAYMDNPDSVDLSILMSVYHLFKSKSVGRPYYQRNRKNIRKLKSTIYSQYFLYRAKSLGANAPWIDRALTKTDKRLKKWLPQDLTLDFSEGSRAHEFFLEAFTLREADRYKADKLLLKEVLRKPTNLITNFYVSGVNLWNGSEADYDDPTILYSYIISSYFAERIQDLTILAQQKWLEDPEENELFRGSLEIGGFTLPARRWLAKLHNNDLALESVDQEIPTWLERFPQFYSFTGSATPSTEPGRLAESINRYFAGITSCTSVPEPERNRFCGNTPRAPFNVITFQFFGLDLFLQAGDVGTATAFLDFKYFPPLRFDTWTLGQESWNYREDNFDNFIERHQNDDPNDNPVAGVIKTQKWGSSSTCQLCHQNQNFVVSDEDRNATPPRFSDEELFFEVWPSYTVSWYGELIH